MKVKTSFGSYAVEFCPLEDALARVPNDGVVFTDATVGRIYRQHIEPFRTITVPVGEASKSMSRLGKSLENLSALGANRSTTLVAFGGGVVGDLGGLVAALYMRGIPYIQIPATLLAQVDSSVGGKVAVDLKAGKNLAGAFYPPQRVFVPVHVLRTLNQRQFRNGIAEVLKYGFIADPGVLDLVGHAPLSAQTEEERLVQMIRRCIEIKADIVQQDEFETTGLRSTLNFGHTIGHAIEASAGFSRVLHGEAISIGMYLEAVLGEKLGISEPGTAERVRAALHNQGLPTQLAGVLEVAQILPFIARDKKRQTPDLAFSLLTRIGECKLVQGVAPKDVEKVLSAR